MNRSSPLLWLCAVAALLALSGCTRVTVNFPDGSLYGNSTVPVTIKDAMKISDPVQVPQNLAVGRSTSYRVGMALPSPWAVLSVGWGDMSMQAAQENGNLAEVTYADAKRLTILFLFRKTTLIAYGPKSG